MGEFDLIVIGAGVYGVTGAVTYHRQHPEERILIIDAAPSVGGPWAPHRSFPSLKTNNLYGTYQIPDFPMDKARFRVKEGEHLPAEAVAKYLSAYVEDHGLKECLRLNTKVETIEKLETGWRLHCCSTEAGSRSATLLLDTEKLLVSVGLTNQPFMPHYATPSNFSPPVIHSKDFASRFSDIVKPRSHTIIVGSGKSAWDIAYECATQPDSTATMLIRPNGNGPGWLAPSHVTPFGLWLEKLVFTRFIGYLSPCPFAEMTGLEGLLRRFFHGTWLGRKIVNAFWNILSEDVVTLNKLNDHPETKKLRPWRNAFEIGNAVSVLNYPSNWFDLVKAGKINIVIDEIDRFEGQNDVVLKSGDKIKTDAVVCATGWKIGDSIKFKPESLRQELGLPSYQQPGIEEAALIKKVTGELYEQYPYLQMRDTGRTHHPDPALRGTSVPEPSHQPYRLYRFMVPQPYLQQRSIGFLGALMCLGNPFCAYIQALWLTAYLDGTLELPHESSGIIQHEIFRDSQYCALRMAAGYGDMAPDLVFESLPYFDKLLHDLGLEGKRKGAFLGQRNWLAESFRSYGPEDYKGLVEEYRKRVTLRGATRKKNS